MSGRDPKPPRGRVIIYMIWTEETRHCDRHPTLFEKHMKGIFYVRHTTDSLAVTCCEPSMTESDSRGSKHEDHVYCSLNLVRPSTIRESNAWSVLPISDQQAKRLELFIYLNVDGEVYILTHRSKKYRIHYMAFWMDKEDHKILNLGIFWTFASAGVRIHEVLTQGLGIYFQVCGDWGSSTVPRAAGGAFSGYLLEGNTKKVAPVSYLRLVFGPQWVCH